MVRDDLALWAGERAGETIWGPCACRVALLGAKTMKTPDAELTLARIEVMIDAYTRVAGAPPARVLIGLMQMRAIEDLPALQPQVREIGAAMLKPPGVRLMVKGIPVAVGSLDDHIRVVPHQQPCAAPEDGEDCEF